jgi:hypothetical protein
MPFQLVLADTLAEKRLRIAVACSGVPAVRRFKWQGIHTMIRNGRDIGYQRLDWNSMHQQ